MNKISTGVDGHNAQKALQISREMLYRCTMLGVEAVSEMSTSVDKICFMMLLTVEIVSKMSTGVDLLI